MTCGMGYADIPVDSSRILALKEKELLVSEVLDYKKQIFELKQDLLTLKSDKEWLDVKIMHFETQGRTVPDEMTASKDLIVKKQSQIALDISKFNGLCKQHLQEMRHLDARVKRENGNKAPVWWRWDDQISRLMASEGNESKPAAEMKKPEIAVKKADSTTEISPFRKGLEDKIKAADLDNWVALVSGDKGLKLEVQLPILFGHGKSSVAKDYKPFFKKLSALLKPYQVRIDVTGYADGDKIRSKHYSSKIELGTKRAANVMHELIKAGMPPSIFKVSSEGAYGSHDPTKKGLSAAMKRRVEVNVYFKDPKA
jgi:flagellar motor protein MotB